MWKVESDYLVVSFHLTFKGASEKAAELRKMSMGRYKYQVLEVFPDFWYMLGTVAAMIAIGVLLAWRG